MITDARRPPFCFQTQPALDLIRDHFEGAKRSTALAVYLVLTETANRIGGAEARTGFRESRATIAESVGVSVDTLDRYVSTFIKIGLLEVEREQMEGVNLPNRWILLDPKLRTGAGGSRTGAARGGRTGAAQESEEEQPGKEQRDRRTVADAWRANAPPLIEHRDTFFSSSAAKTAIRVACRTYPASAVAAAIANYATVIASDDYRWSYRWTLTDFLRRGLDRFVPEANPLENFRTRDATGGARDAALAAVDDI